MSGEISSFDGCPYHIHIQKEIDRLAGNDSGREHATADLKVAIAQLTANIDQLVKVASNHDTDIKALRDSELTRKGSMKILVAELLIASGIISSAVAGLIVKFA